MHGEGTFTWTDGKKYIGNYRNDIKTGWGTYIFQDGSKYLGNFKNGKMHGKGVFSNSLGSPRGASW